MSQNHNRPLFGRLAFVSTYPPTQCGLATFTQSLIRGMTSPPIGENLIGVLSVGNRPTNFGPTPSEVIGYLEPRLSSSVREAAARLNEYDVVIIQHEFGIFGADDGAAALELLGRLRVPVIVTLHTVSSAPTVRQRAILERLVEMADYVVVMSYAARFTLEREYKTDPSKIRLIPHGSHCYPNPAPKPRSAPVILSWGLIGPGKGIEWGG